MARPGRPIIIVLAVIAATVIPVLLWPTLIGDTYQWTRGADPEPQVEVHDVVLALPARAGNPALLLFEIENSGGSDVQVTEISVGGVGVAQFVDTARPAPAQMANIFVPAGTRASFGREGPRAVLTQFGSQAVPGAQLPVHFTLGNADTIQATATVLADRQATDTDALQDASPALRQP